MKQILIFLTFLIIARFVQAADGEKEVASTIQTVKVFRQGAQIIRIGRINIPAGRTTLKFADLPSGIIPNTIQFNAEGDFTILSINSETENINEWEQSAAYHRLTQAIDSLSFLKKKAQAISEALEREEVLILNNSRVSAPNEGITADKLEAMAVLYRNRFSEINLKKLEINQNIERWDKEMRAIRNELSRGKNENYKIKNLVLVNISSKDSITFNFELSYLIGDAGWYPIYDIRVKDVSQPVALIQKATVHQNSGEEWKNVKLILSTGNPNRSGQKPELERWLLQIRFVPPVVKKDEEIYEMIPPDIPENVAIATITQEGEKFSGIEEIVEEPREKEVEFAKIPDIQMFENTITFEYTIETPYTIPNNGKQYAVSINEYTIPAYYEYYAAPKLDKTAYLTAQLTNWDQYNLLNGEANLYFEGTFLGKSFLDVQSTEDTLTLSLGRDESVVVTRTKEKQFGESQFLGNKKTETRGWDIELRNKKKQKINIVVEDQYPLSTNDDIEVTLENAKGAEVDKESGLLKWKLALDAGKSEKLNFRYSVKYPKKQKLVLE